MTKTAEAALFEQIDEVNDRTLLDVPEGKQKPVMGSFEWNDYVLDQLHEKEFRTHGKNKYPTTDGLKRLVYKLLGRIIRSESNVISPGNHENDFTVTVEHRTTILPYNPDLSELVFTGVADVNAKNLDKPFDKYLTSNASTRAMGRSFRDALMIRVCVAEELSNVAENETFDDPEDAQPITDSQKAGIRSICKRNGIDVDKFIQLGPFPHKSIDKILTGTARKMVSVLNGYQNDEKKIPKEILLEE